jgi:hypothetical protein
LEALLVANGFTLTCEPESMGCALCCTVQESRPKRAEPGAKRRKIEDMPENVSCPNSAPSTQSPARASERPSRQQPVYLQHQAYLAWASGFCLALLAASAQSVHPVRIATPDEILKPELRGEINVDGQPERPSAPLEPRAVCDPSLDNNDTSVDLVLASFLND